IMRSRVTLAMTEAAAIEKLSESPLTTVCTTAVMGGAMLPSTSTTSGLIPSTSTARAIANSAARRMLTRSISCALVAEHFRETAGVKNHGSRDHRPGERPPPCLIDAAHQAPAPAFEREIRHFLPQRRLCHAAGAGAS